jgi:hypothetical protein
MKHIYLTLIAFSIAFACSAKTIKTVQNNYWENTGSWNLSRLPQDNDTIVIAAGSTTTLDVNVQLNNVVILVYGTFQFNNGKLRLDNPSQIIVENTGEITGINSNDQITIGSTLKFSGTELNKSGYSFANSSTGTSPNGFVSSVLPVVFQSFYVTRQGGNIQLYWTTSAEFNNKYFEIERSTDGRNWKSITQISGTGTSSAVNQYSYTDRNISDATVYYRIHQFDLNGSSEYSAIRTLHSNTDASVTNIYACGKQAINIDFNSNVKNNVTIQVVTMNGQVIARKNYKQASYRVTINLAATAGIYVVQVSDATGWSEVKKIAFSIGNN